MGSKEASSSVEVTGNQEPIAMPPISTGFERIVTDIQTAVGKVVVEGSQAVEDSQAAEDSLAVVGSPELGIMEGMLASRMDSQSLLATGLVPDSERQEAALACLVTELSHPSQSSAPLHGLSLCGLDPPDEL